MNKSDLNKEISLLIKDLNFLRQNPRIEEKQLDDLKTRLQEAVKALQP